MEHSLEGQLRALCFHIQIQRFTSRKNRFQICLHTSRRSLQLRGISTALRILPISELSWHNELISMEASNGIVSNDGRGSNEESKHNEKVKNEDKTDENEKNNRLQRTKADCLVSVYLESPISLSTTWRSLRRLGFSYDAQKKTFFVDGHKQPNVVFQRNQFCKNYLSKLEPRFHWWIQVTKNTAENWKREKMPAEFN